MLKAMLERRLGHLSNAEFEVICDITTADIKFNNINFGRRTSLEDLIVIATRCDEVIKR